MGRKRKPAARARQPDSGSAATAALERWLELALAAQARGAAGEARTYFRKLVGKDPSRAPVWHALAGVCYQLGETSEAVEALERACELEPNNVETLGDLGGLYLATGALPAAERILKTVVGIDPEYGQAQYNLASVLYQSGKVTEAIAELNRLLQREPAFAEAQFNLAIALRDIGNPGGALAAFRLARKLQPENARTYLELARLETEAHLAADAIRHFREYLERTPHDPEVVCELAELLHRDGQTDTAVALLEDALRAELKSEKPGLALGGILHNAGRLDAAEAAYRAVLENFPHATSAAVGLSRLRRFTDPHDPILSRLTATLEQNSLAPEQAEPVHFALGKIYDDLEGHEQAFAHYAAGNNTHARSVNYDRAAAEAQVDGLIEVFSADALRIRAAYASASEKPVLIVGMPRSGTTLTEQIIAAHAEVAAAGELAFFSALAQQLPLLSGSELRYPQCWADVNEDLAATMIDQYLGLLERHGPDAARVTDKMPVNYKHVGLVLRLFPRARVLVCRRDPRDVALSIYFQYFRERHDYAWSLTDIAHCYVQHERLLQHWLAASPDTVHEIRYADLVTRHESAARRLIDIVGLGWDPNCLEFHKFERDVKTASNWQVRQPIYDTSLERWRRYEAYLGDFTRTLHAERNRYAVDAAG